MQDENFKEFLKGLNNKTTVDLGLQTLQVKYDREMAGKDNDRRENQLEDINKTLVRIENLVKIKKSLTGKSSVAFNNSTAEKQAVKEGSTTNSFSNFFEGFNERRNEIASSFTGKNPRVKEETLTKQSEQANTILEKANFLQEEQLQNQKLQLKEFQKFNFNLEPLGEAIGKIGNDVTKIKDKPVPVVESAAGGGSALDVLGSAGKTGIGAKLAGGFKGAMAGGGATIATGAAMVAAPFAVDAGLGALGLGKKEIDEKQDKANFQRMSFGEKVESGFARGIEKVGSLFGGNITNEARAKRIQKETEYLNKKTSDSQKPTVAGETSTISLATFAQNDPKGFEEYQKFVQDEMEKGKKQVEEDFKSGKKKGDKKVFMEDLERNVKKKALDKFKDKMMAAGAMETKTNIKGEARGKDGTSKEMNVDEMKAMRQKIADKGPRTQNPQSIETHQEKLRTMDMAIAAKEKAGEDVTGMGSDSEYKPVDTGSLRQGQQGLKAQHEQFIKDTKPARSVKEEAPKKTIGERIASFFGFGKEKTSKGNDISSTKEKTAAAYDLRDRAALAASQEVVSPTSVDKSKMHPMARRQLEDLEKYNKSNQQAQQAELAASNRSSALAQQVAQGSAENVAIRDQMSNKPVTTQPVVSNNVSNNNTTSYVPVKADPRPMHRGSALDRYVDRTAAY